MPGMNRLYGVTKIIQDTSERFERPAFAALRLPYFAVIFERSKGDEGIVR